MSHTHTHTHTYTQRHTMYFISLRGLDLCCCINEEDCFFEMHKMSFMRSSWSKCSCLPPLIMSLSVLKQGTISLSNPLIYVYLRRWIQQSTGPDNRIKYWDTQSRGSFPSLLFVSDWSRVALIRTKAPSRDEFEDESLVSVPLVRWRHTYVIPPSDEIGRASCRERV